MITLIFNHKRYPLKLRVAFDSCSLYFGCWVSLKAFLCQVLPTSRWRFSWAKSSLNFTCEFRLARLISSQDSIFPPHSPSSTGPSCKMHYMQGAFGTAQKLNLKLSRTCVMSDIIIIWKCSGARTKIVRNFSPTVWRWTNYPHRLGFQFKTFFCTDHVPSSSSPGHCTGKSPQVSGLPHAHSHHLQTVTVGE